MKPFTACAGTPSTCLGSRRARRYDFSTRDGLKNLDLRSRQRPSTKEFSAPTMPPPIPPRPVGTLLHKHANPQLVIEVFLDYNCPFSGKMFNVLNDEVLPAFKTDGRVDMLFQNVPQPWHPQSAWMHEVGLAVKLLDESKFYASSSKIFANQTKFTDKASLELTRLAAYESLADAATDGTGVDRDGLLKLLTSQDPAKETMGEQVVLMMKFACKYHRVRGIHVTPTVFLNGIEAPDVGSSWTAEQWREKISACLENSAKL